MFARRGFNIESLAVGPTERHDISRITLRVDCDEHALAQIEKQMHKLVNVLRITRARARRVARARAGADQGHRAARAPRRADGARARCSPPASPTSGPDAIVFEISATPEEIDSFEELVRPHGIQELVRTGRVGARPRVERLVKRGQLVLH